MGRRESIGVVNTHNAYFLWSMRRGHFFDLAYFVTLAIRHQTERHRKGVISIDPYRGFDLPQYRLVRAFDKDDNEDIPDDIPPVQDEPPSQPPPRHRPVHAAASLSEVSNHLHRFEQYYTQ
ncbi:hypothetical protein GOBAR_AA25273 [Gossypium barbadense]|uniref:Uncharacterized protein n=1 Tax=Gossypium barbadense TaxID=3634 RepID=A0A2P5WWD4_GOSBA|nr:hypothetical protein GOBAR_AA25273 [Gossypium barbadense]